MSSATDSKTLLVVEDLNESDRGSVKSWALNILVAGSGADLVCTIARAEYGASVDGTSPVRSAIKIARPRVPSFRVFNF